jgi:hypothetical protein
MENKFSLHERTDELMDGKLILEVDILQVDIYPSRMQAASEYRALSVLECGDVEVINLCRGPGHHTALSCTVLHCTALHCTLLHCTAL